MDPSSPSTSATTGVDSLNNEEQVYVASPSAGDWTITVTGTGVPQGPQSFSLVFSVLSMTSYRDSERTEVSTSFVDPYRTVYLKSTGLLASHAYTVGYYDASNSLKLSDGVTSDAGGNLNSQGNFQSTGGTPGTWHAVVYDNDVASPPSTYAANDVNSALEDSFTVQASAIPEFPTMVAALFTIILLGAAYYWIRRRFRPGIESSVMKSGA